MTHFKCPNCSCIEYNMGHECLTCGNRMRLVADIADDRIADMSAELSAIRATLRDKQNRINELEVELSKESERDEDLFQKYREAVERIDELEFQLKRSMSIAG